MKVVVDTNVIMSAIFFGGVPLKVLDKWRAGAFELLVSHEILEEYYSTGKDLQSRFKGIDPTPQLNLIAVNATLTFGISLPEQICTDPDDDKFFSCALAGSAEVIVSGDSHILSVGAYQGVRAVKPRDFLDMCA